MQRLSEAGQTMQRVHAGFGLAKAYCDIGEHDKSVRAYLEANLLQSVLRPFDLDRSLGQLAETRDFFAGLTAPPRSGRGRDLAFVIGLPRSGKSSIEQELAKAEGAFPSGESRLLLKLADATDDFDVIGREYERAAAVLAPGRLLVNASPNWTHVGHIRHALPEARVIHAVRGGPEHRIAMLQKHFASGQGYTNTVSSLLAYEAAYRDMMAFWETLYPGFVVARRATGNGLPPGQLAAWSRAAPALFE